MKTIRQNAYGGTNMKTLCKSLFFLFVICMNLSVFAKLEVSVFPEKFEPTAATVTTNDSVNEPAGDFVPSEIDGGLPEHPRIVLRIENDQLVEVNEEVLQNVTDENILFPAGDQSCSTAVGSIYGQMMTEIISGTTDVDWYTGTRQGTGPIRVVLVPPNNKNYDIQIYDFCGQASPVTCSASTGQLENCTATVMEDYFVKVYGQGGSWSVTAPYYIMSYKDGTCNFSVTPGTPNQSNYACHDDIFIDNSVVHNQNSTSLSHQFNVDLWRPSGNFVTEREFGSFNIGANGNVNWDAWLYAPTNGWPAETGTFTARYVVVGYCSSNQAINAVKTSSSPNISCQPCQDECQPGTNHCLNSSTSQSCGNYDTSDSCLEWGGNQFCSNGCNQSTGQCTVCQSHHHKGCFPAQSPNDVYWYNSCNQVEEIFDDCRISCDYSPTQDYYCIDGCLGNFLVTAKNAQGATELNATVSFKRQDQSQFQFAGLTNSQGKFSFSDVWPNGNACGIGYELKVVSASGADCGSRFTQINSEGDTDGVMFNCPIVNNNNFLRVLPDSSPSTINLGQSLQMQASIVDMGFNPVAAALVGVIRPYNSVPLSNNSDSAGSVLFSDSLVPAGSHNFHFIASKPNYNYGGAWKQVTVAPQQVEIAVRDNLGNPVWHAAVLKGAQVIGYTNNQGKYTATVTQQITTFETRNTESISCGFRTVQIGEQANFICASVPKLRVEVDNNFDLPLSNVVVALDGAFVDYSNSFGYVVTTVASGEHLLQIYYKMDENSQAYLQQQSIIINQPSNVVSVVADESQGTIVDLENLSIQGLDVSGQIAIIPIALIAIDLVSIYFSIEDTCACLAQNTNNEDFTVDYCRANLGGAVFGGLPAVLSAGAVFRAFNVELESCPAQYAGLLFDVSPALGAGIVSKLGIAAFATKLGSKLHLAEVWTSLKHIGQEVTEQVLSATEKKLIGHDWDYYVKILPDGQQIKQVWLRNLDGTKLSAETTNMIEQAVINPQIGLQPAKRTLDGIGFRVIPDNPSHVDRLTEYARVSLNQGFEPYADGIHKLQKLYIRPGINTQVGQQVVNGAAVLKKGDLVSWGYDHIFVYLRPGETTTRAQQILEKFPSFHDNGGILTAMKQIVETGEQIPGYSNRFRYGFVDNQNTHRYLEVWLADNHLGSLGTVVIGDPV